VEGGQVADPATLGHALSALAAAGRLEPQALDRPAARALGDEGPLAARAGLLRAAVAVGRKDVADAVSPGLVEALASLGVFGGRGLPAPDAPDATTRWQDDWTEGAAVALLALLEAGHDRAALARGARWLLQRRDAGDRWQSTRDTGAVVRFLAAYTQATGDLGAGKTARILVDGALRREVTLTPEQALSPAAVETIEGLAPGQRVRISVETDAAGASAGIALRFHETGPAIAASSNGFSVVRRWHVLEPEARDGRTTWTRVPATETVPAGALVEAEVEVTTDRARAFVLVTSPHVAGLEPHREVAEEVVGRRPATPARVDRRDAETFWYVGDLPAGTHVFRHTFRATHPGAYTALPASAELMYFPDVRGTSDGETWQVTPVGAAGRDGR
jgi:uncharacterized protein YfaS (alpha-2-macroglobulin family)